MIVKQTILDTIEDLCSDFLYYDRKEDEDLTMELLNKAVEDGEITVKEMVDKFESCLRNTYS
ncbi:hypothetical protein ES692_06035 [Psychroserpens burtonensis]|uniref:Uncharacterized protein n=1 Tax=Psychroserpens burtonensis TaxID=49278 RepID=A0A5C7B8F7_9FLAO|nr:hypothetical protein [Psychroserpens burtonensis]TXE18600.1 hypothetical protein ES692_06035 [Psychroserpens burtonensis]